MKTIYQLFNECSVKLIALYAIDQKLRKRAEEDPTYWDDTVDRTASVLLGEIVDMIGWPTVSKVGMDASRAAAMIARHADHDVFFQDRCLRLMKMCTPPDVDRADIAHLEDRICVNHRMPQVYGTQFRQIDGKHMPCEIFDPDNVDRRRKDMGLDSLQENILRMQAKYPLA